MMRHMGLAVAVLLTGSPAWAIDVSGADILGLRLAMSEQDVTAQLANQGFSATTLPDRCTENDVCLVKAATKDGSLLITLSGKAGAQQVEYAFRGHGPGEPQKIQAAMTDRFGDPNQQAPMTWCRAVDTNGTCPRDRASLTFRPQTLTIILKSGTSEQVR